MEEMEYATKANRALGDDLRGCLGDTRREVIEDIFNWATQSGPPGKGSRNFEALVPERRVLWLHGMAGTGKSSIAISLARKLKRERLLGSFYGFEVAQRDAFDLKPTNLFSTITRHLARHDAARKQHLIKMDSDQRATTSISEQFEKLLLSVGSVMASKDVTVIVIDAFDECGTSNERAQVLKILTQRANEIPDGIRVVVTSRAEDDIVTALDQSQSELCVLKMGEIPKNQTERDIYAFVVDTLRDEHGLSSQASRLTELALAAEESFQWASTACAFIKNRNGRGAATTPKTRLQQVLSKGKGLDGLYGMILDALDRAFCDGTPLDQLEDPDDGFNRLQTILGILACAREPLSLQAIISLGIQPDSEVDVDEYHWVLRRLASLFTGTHDVTSLIIPLHTSVTDFLLDKGRSKAYYVNPAQFKDILASRCLDIMLTGDKGLRFNICKLPTSYKRNRDIPDIEELVKKNISLELSYSCRFWAHHVSEVEKFDVSLTDSVTEL